MYRRLTATALGLGLAATAGAAVALYAGEGENERVKRLPGIEILEKVDGKVSTASAAVITIEPGQSGKPHRHTGPVLGYVIEGEFLFAINDEPERVLKAGETFYEPSGAIHRVSGNAGKTRTRIVAWVVHPRELESTVPVDSK